MIFTSDKNMLFACGNNDHDQLGVETAQQALVRPQKLTGWDSRNEIRRLYANAELSAVLTVAGDLFTFGSNEFGQLGRSTRNRIDCLHPTKVNLQGPCMALGLGYRHAVAARVQTITDQNSSAHTILLVSWGQLNGGRLGFTKCDLRSSQQEMQTMNNWTVDRSGSVFRGLNSEMNPNYLGINGTNGACQHIGPTIIPTFPKLEPALGEIVNGISCGFSHSLVSVRLTESKLLEMLPKPQMNGCMDDRSQRYTKHLNEPLVVASTHVNSGSSQKQVWSTTKEPKETSNLTLIDVVLVWGSGENGQLGIWKPNPTGVGEECCQIYCPIPNAIFTNRVRASVQKFAIFI
ncbi:uncharacterized protein DEA37_0012617 [Paragonimus westermani]|uniref:Secretion-regulating guanine nucleotide exchange factor n=1 Tax=Paragonimus westermani TaxID=34504 RepID=A0A5J4NRX2_9TREM|nr:uncharacterized protein DEA37_0012617 [Paragonimus westermani]